MRDPDVMGRAQRAATELEQAWDRWRSLHGISREPMPAVSSYVGYSLEEPWGQPRVVFGIEAREAEQLAALLDHHECSGPVYAGLSPMPSTQPEQRTELIAATPERGRVLVPSQAQATVAEREAAWREATWREATVREQEADPRPRLSARETPAARAEDDERGPAKTRRDDLGAGDDEFTPQDRAASLRDDVDDDEDDDMDVAEKEPEELADDEPGTPEDVGHAAGWQRRARGAAGHALPRTKRSTSVRGAAGKRTQE